MLKQIPVKPENYPFDLAESYEYMGPDRHGKRMPGGRYIIGSTTKTPEEVARFPYLGADDAFLVLTANKVSGIDDGTSKLPDVWEVTVDVVTRNGRLRRGLTVSQRTRILDVASRWLRSSATGKLSFKDSAEVALVG